MQGKAPLKQYIKEFGKLHKKIEPVEITIITRSIAISFNLLGGRKVKEKL